MASGGPTGAFKRSWRRFRRRSPATQIGALILAVLIVAGIAYGVAAGTSGSSSSSAASVAGAGPAPSGISVNDASTSSRGVSSNSINVVFPVSNLTSLASNFGFQGDVEFNEQQTAIHIFVNAINNSGGINGRTINPIIVTFDPTNEASMRALCKQWTNGSPPVFAVIDGIGSWEGDNQLCIAQEGQTPFIAQWSTINSWSQAAAPYLWWTGPNQSAELQTLVSWAKSAGFIGSGRKLGIVAGDRPSDTQALNGYLLPYLHQAGIQNVVVETLPAQTSEQAETTAEAPLVVQRFVAAGVDSVIPLIPFNAFFPYLQAEAQQNYAPRLLLSDYESSIEVALGLIPTPYEKQLNGQEGITVETLGGTDAPIPESQGGYDPGMKTCYDTWHAAFPNPIPGQTLAPGEQPSDYIEEQGPIAGWCQGITLFAEAATRAGRDLTRRSFVQAMASIKNFQGTYSPTLSYGPDKFAGPSEYRVVQLHDNTHPSSACVPLYTGKPQGTCWHVVSGWQPLLPG